MTALIDELALPGQPALPGLRFRRFRGPEDYAGMAAANQAARDGDGIEEVVSVVSIANTYEHLVNSDPRTDLVIVERAGRIVGYARVEWRDLTDGTRQYFSICLLDPAERGRGIGGTLLAWTEARLATIASGLPDAASVPGTMYCYTFGADRHATSLLTARGWTEDGRGYEMVRATLDEVPSVPMPEGLVVRPIGLDEAARRQVWDASSEAFRDHRSETETAEEDWAAFLADPRQDPSLWLVGFDGDEVAGAVLGLIDPIENAHHGRERGVLASVFTRRPWRRRGLARALIARALVRLRDHGMTSAYLGVDGLNPNQAMTLYSSLGFEVASQSIDWKKPLPPETGVKPPVPTS
jgi:mycothiol synthase